MHTGFWWRDLRESDHLEDLGVDGRKILKYRIFSTLIRTSFCRFLKRKKKLVRCSNPHLSFNRPLPTRQTDSVMSDDGESDE